MPAGILVGAEIHSQAEKLRTLKNDFVGNFNKVLTTVDELPSVWRSKAATEFIKSFHDASKNFVSFAEAIDGFATFINQYADDMENGDRDAVVKIPAV